MEQNRLFLDIVLTKKVCFNYILTRLKILPRAYARKNRVVFYRIFLEEREKSVVHASNLESIKKKLRARKAELEAELLRLSRERVYEESIPDPSDQASLSTLEEVNISLENNE